MSPEKRVKRARRRFRPELSPVFHVASLFFHNFRTAKMQVFPCFFRVFHIIHSPYYYYYTYIILLLLLG